MDRLGIRVLGSDAGNQTRQQYHPLLKAWAGTLVIGVFVRWLPFLSACRSGSSFSALPPTPPPTPVILIGTDAQVEHNRPSDWPTGAGDWNGKAARYHVATQKLVFETYHDDIRGGSIVDAGITAAGANEYYVAGPGTGTSKGIVGTGRLVVDACEGSSRSTTGTCGRTLSNTGLRRVLHIKAVHPATCGPAIDGLL